MNIATALKAEISRVARKELRGETQQLKKSGAQYRAEIAALKRRMAALERLVKASGKPRRTPAVKVDPDNAPLRHRFSPTGLFAHRTRLGLTAAEMGVLIGVSGQSIYKWEQKKAAPRASQLMAIRAALKLGKREAAARLATDSKPA
jgi:DNA-binding XRE family transcriptional regulator